MARGPHEDLPQLKQRLFVGTPGATAAPRPPAAGAADGWRSYRGNMRRSFSSPVSVPAEARVLWKKEHAAARQAAAGDESGLDYGLGRMADQWMFEAEFVPRPPVIAGNRAIVARSTGAVDAYDLESGARLWRAYTGGRIQSVPTIWRDRIFVGSCDGFLYALALDDGREIYRLHAAPKTARMMFYEQLGSRWPILGSPAVHDGNVYVMAGLLEEIDDVHAVCADAETGRILWERSDWTAAETEGKLTGGGQFSVADRLFYHGDKAPPIRIDPKDGSCKPAFPETAAKRYNTIHAKDFLKAWMVPKGQDSAILDPKWILYGGRRLLVNEGDHGTWRYTPKILGRDESGGGRLPVIDLPTCTLLPAWDEHDVFFVSQHRRKQNLTMIARDKLMDALEGMLSGTSNADFLAEGVFKRKGFQIDFIPAGKGLYRWNVELEGAADPMMWALSGNAALLVYSEHWNRHPPRLAAFARADGRLMWEIDLPGLPVHSGIAVAAGGRIVLSMRDGSVLTIGE